MKIYLSSCNPSLKRGDKANSHKPSIFFAKHQNLTKDVDVFVKKIDVRVRFS